MELLAPAGSPEKLRAAVAYGADAIYLAGLRYGLRSSCGNFTPEDLADGVAHAHGQGVRVYLALNLLAHPEDFDGMRETVRDAAACGIDAAIVADPGVFSLVREEAPRLPVHISTQASVTNARACRFWHAQGARRIVLARELTLAEILDIHSDIPEDLELEAFAHGSMCMAYSGRCLLSNRMTGRDANRGRCAQPCRWKYSLVEEKRPEERFPVEQDREGAYILNSRDLCMVEHLGEMERAGVDALKIEGRAKSAFYAAMTTKAYRMALDALAGEPGAGGPKEWLEILGRTSHRPFSTGFYFAPPSQEAQVHAVDSDYVREADIVGCVLSWDAASGFGRISQRNRFAEGEPLLLLQPRGAAAEFLASEMRDGEGNPIRVAPHPEMQVQMPLPGPVQPHAYLARAGPAVRSRIRDGSPQSR